MRDRPEDARGERQRGIARHGSARAVIMAMRQADPNSTPFALYKKYTADNNNPPVGFQHFSAVVRAVDRMTGRRP